MTTPNYTPATVTWDELVQQLGLTTSPGTTIKQRSKAAPAALFAASLDQLMQQSCQDGQRTQHLTQLVGSLLASGFDLAESLKHCHRWNKNNHPPLEDDKIISTCESIHAIDQRNHPERHPNPMIDEPLFELAKGRINRYLSTPPPQRRWLLQDLVVLGKVGAVVAPGGSSKSQWMLQLAVSVATGIPLADHWKVGETGGVIVLFAEDDEDEIHRRLHRIQTHLTMQGFNKELAPLCDRLFIFSTIGTDTLLTKKGTTGEVSATVTVDRIAALARQVPDLRLIVVDPGSRFRGGEENSNEDATRFVEALEKLAQQTGATLMLAHHTNKYSSASGGEVSQSASRGASALTDGLRWQMNLNRPTDSQATTFNLHKGGLSNYVAATVTKTNYSAVPAPVLLERGQDGYLSAVNPEKAKNDVESKAILALMRVLESQAKPISARRLEDHYGGLQNALKMSKQHVRGFLDQAIKRGYLVGGERKSLTITPLGHDWSKCFPPPTADAPSLLKSASGKKP